MTEYETKGIVKLLEVWKMEGCRNVTHGQAPHPSWAGSHCQWAARGRRALWVYPATCGRWCWWCALERNLQGGWTWMERWTYLNKGELLHYFFSYETITIPNPFRYKIRSTCLQIAAQWQRGVCVWRFWTVRSVNHTHVMFDIWSGDPLFTFSLLKFFQVLLGSFRKSK